MLSPRRIKPLIILLALVMFCVTAAGWDALVNEPVTKRFDVTHCQYNDVMPCTQVPEETPSR